MSTIFFLRRVVTSLVRLLYRRVNHAKAMWSKMNTECSGHLGFVPTNGKRDASGTVAVDSALQLFCCCRRHHRTEIDYTVLELNTIRRFYIVTIRGKKLMGDISRKPNLPVSNQDSADVLVVG